MPNVVFDASTLVGALLKEASIPEQALLRARSQATICLSNAVQAEIEAVFHRPKFAKYLVSGRIQHLLAILLAGAHHFEPGIHVADCRDPKDDKYLELAHAAQAAVLVSSDFDLLVLHPWRATAIVTPSAFLNWPLG